MPHFNEFRMNEELLGKVLVARKNFDLSATDDEQMEVRKFINELEEEKRTEKKSFKLRFLELITGKKLVQFKDQFGKKIIREYTPETGLKPELHISITLDRQIDFGDDVNEWRRYIHEENIRSEQKRIDKRRQAKEHATIVSIYAEIIYKKMMKIN